MSIPKKPRRKPFDAYWKNRTGDMMCSKREAKYWFLKGISAENSHMNRCWERNKALAEIPIGPDFQGGSEK